MSDIGFTTREEIERQQAERLPALALRIRLHPQPVKAVQAAVLQDAIELSAADTAPMLESGREFADLSDAERDAIFQRNYQHCMDRVGRFFQAQEDRN